MEHTEISGRIRTIAQKKGISQAEIARRMKVTPQMVHHYLNHGRKYNLEILQRLGKAIGVHPAVFLLEKEFTNYLSTYGEGRVQAEASGTDSS